MKERRRRDSNAVHQPSLRGQREPIRVKNVSFVRPSSNDLRANLFRLFDLLELGDEIRSPLNKQLPGVK